MKNLSITLFSTVALTISGCSGNKADGNTAITNDTTVADDDSMRAGAPPADSLFADSTTNAPKMSGQ